MAEEAGAATAAPAAAAPAASAPATASSPAQAAAPRLSPTSVFGLGQPPTTARTLRDQVMATFPAALAGAAAIVVSLGFVAAVGALMLWVRFSSAGLPADQAIVVVPREDFIAIGAVLLLQYVFVGVAAVLLVHVRDRYGNASRGTRRAVADLLLVELVGVGLIVGPSGSCQTWKAIGAAALVVAAWFALRVTVWLSPEGRTEKVIAGERRAIIADWFADRAHQETAEREAELDLIRRTRVTPARDAVDKSASQWAAAEKEFRDTTTSGKGLSSRQLTLARTRTGEAAAAAVNRLNSALARLRAASAAEAKAEIGVTDAEHLETQSAGSAAWAERRLVEAQREALIDPAAGRAGDRDKLWHWWTHDFLWKRVALRIGALFLAIAAALLLGHGLWPVFVVLVAAALALGALGVAQATSGTRFFWTGVALFAGGLLFGAAFTLLRTDASPKLQPVAILLKAEPGEISCDVVKGAFIARTGDGKDDRIYYGTARKQGDAYDFINGRVTSVPNSRVAAWGVGELAKPYGSTKPLHEPEPSEEFTSTSFAIEADLRKQVASSDCNPPPESD